MLIKNCQNFLRSRTFGISHFRNFVRIHGIQKHRSKRSTHVRHNKPRTTLDYKGVGGIDLERECVATVPQLGPLWPTRPPCSNVAETHMLRMHSRVNICLSDCSPWDDNRSIHPRNCPVSSPMSPFLKDPPPSPLQSIRRTSYFNFLGRWTPLENLKQPSWRCRCRCRKEEHAS